MQKTGSFNMKRLLSLACLFAVSCGFAADAALTEGWTVEPMTADETTIRTDGELIYANGSGAKRVVNGVEFSPNNNLNGENIAYSSEATFARIENQFGWEGLAGDYNNFLAAGWGWGSDDSTGETEVTFTLKGLDRGDQYLLQFVAHRKGASEMTVSAGGKTAPVHGVDEANYKYGASLVYVFTADAVTKEVTLSYAGSGICPLNAVQVRKTVDGEPPPIVARDFDELKTAIENAEEGETVFVAPGTIYEATATIVVTMKNVTLKAAAGTGATPVLDGANAHQLIFVAADGFAVEGVKFQNAKGSGTSESAGNRCGAIFLKTESNVKTAKIVDCIFEDCIGEWGGAIWAYDDDQNAGFADRSAYGLISGCTFKRCGVVGTHAQRDGGAILGTMWIENSTFDACFGPAGVAQRHAAVAVSAYTTISNCVFKNFAGDVAALTGHALVGSCRTHWIGDNNTAQDTMVARLLDCRILDNELRTDQTGSLFHERVMLDRCVISNTTSTSVLPALFSKMKTAQCGVANTLFVDNKFPFDVNYLPALENCTFVGNIGGIVCVNPLSRDVAITNCVFWGNAAKPVIPWDEGYKGVPGFYRHGAIDLSHFQIANTIIEGGSANDAIKAVLECDPTKIGEKSASLVLTERADANPARLFKDAGGGGDYAPRSKSSPLVDGGVALAWMSGATDLAGNPRLVGECPDIGCYEFIPKAGFSIIVR